MQVPARLSAVWENFVKSNYVTSFTEWLLGFGARSAHVILIFTMLYMAAQLYPGVDFPDQLNMTVFLIQMFALDMGGMGLASLARQARVGGNVEGADKAQLLSKWLIGIMIASLVVVCMSQAINHLFPPVPANGNAHSAPEANTMRTYIDVGMIVVELVLVVARAVCAVLYGPVIHALKDEMQTQNQSVQMPDLNQLLNDQRAQILTEMQQTLTTFQTTLTAQIQPQIDGLKSQVHPVDYSVLMDGLTQSLGTRLSELEAGLKSSLPDTVDLDELARQAAAMVQSSERYPSGQTVLETEQSEDNLPNVHRTFTGQSGERESLQSPNEVPNVEANKTPRITDKLTEHLPNAERLHLVNNSVRSHRTTESSETAKKIKRLLRKKPTLGPTELATKCSCSKSYASSIKREFMKAEEAS